MADGFILRKGGVSDATPPPTIKFVSKTDTSITFTITNNSLKARDITYGLTTPPTTTTINLAAGATSSNQTISNITEDFVTIFAQAEDSAITEFRVRLEFPIVFTAATGGTTLEYDSGGKRFKSHTFLEDGDFVVSTVGNDDRNKVDYLIIAGGAGGASGGSRPGGGGGAGGYRTTLGTSGRESSAESKFTVTATTFEVKVGAGGNGGSGQNAFDSYTGSNGVNSSALGRTSTGGGGGGGLDGNTPSTTSPKGNNGGSGGGGQGIGFDGIGNNKGLGATIQGFDGGNGHGSSTVVPPQNSGGGGGAGQVGGNGSSGAAGNGGNGLANLLRTGSNETRAGGGGGTSRSSTTGSAGSGGGTAGTRNSNASNATVNTGSGAGAATSGSTSTINLGGNGGSGIVIIRYEIAPSV